MSDPNSNSHSNSHFPPHSTPTTPPMAATGSPLLTPPNASPQSSAISLPRSMPAAPIYFDHHATTPLDPLVIEEMTHILKNSFGNSASPHYYGWEARKIEEDSRHQIAQTLNAKTKEIIFTSGATESNNWVFLGLTHFFQKKDIHIITSSVEHSSVLENAQRFLKIKEKKEGSNREGMTNIEVTVLPVNRYGQVKPEDIEKALRPNTALVSLIFANNEIGSLNPIQEISEITRRHQVLLHSDAAQAYGKVKIDVVKCGVDLLSLSSHKIYGPKGIGALYIRHQSPRIDLAPLFLGGGHERGLRAGTLNIPSIAGFAKAAALADQNLLEENRRLKQLRDQLQEQILREIPEAIVNGDPLHRLDHNLSVTFPHITNMGKVLQQIQSHIALSMGSACSSTLATPSHVLQAIGHPEAWARATLRMGLGRFTQLEEVIKACEILIPALKSSANN